jgi:hypothetical protein
MAAARKLANVAAKGDRRDTLCALRDRLAAAIDDGPSHRDLAALSTRLEVVLVEIEKLSRSEPAKGGVADELRSRRAARAAESRAGS